MMKFKAKKPNSDNTIEVSLVEVEEGQVDIQLKDGDKKTTVVSFADGKLVIWKVCSSVFGITVKDNTFGATVEDNTQSIQGD